MALATGGSAVGAIRMRSRPMSCAFRTAACVGITSTDPSGKTARTSRARMASLTFSRILGRGARGNLDGYMQSSVYAQLFQILIGSWTVHHHSVQRRTLATPLL